MAAAPSRLQLIRLIRTARTLVAGRRKGPALLVGTVLRVWCLRAYPKLPLARLPWSTKLALAPAIQTFVGYLESLPFFDAAYWLSTTYAALSADDYRKTFALYFTPPSIANRLIADLARAGVDFGKDRFVDPACGGAAFLAILASRMRNALKSRGFGSAQILAHAENHLTGIDIDHLLCALSRQFMRMVFYKEILSTRARPHFNIVCSDSLRT
jgi:adenine-specific DNA-methyltransferase